MALRINLQALYRWGSYPQEACAHCDKPTNYGAQLDVYAPPPVQGDQQTEEEADVACEALANRQERGIFTLYQKEMLCGACAGQMIQHLIDNEFSTRVLQPIRREQPERFWTAILLQYEPGAYGQSQAILFSEPAPTTLEALYACALEAAQQGINPRPHLDIER